MFDMLYVCRFCFVLVVNTLSLRPDSLPGSLAQLLFFQKLIL